MIGRELKVNFKGFIIVLLILMLLFGVVYLVYPYMITDDTMKSMDELMQVFPPELLKAFNMDMSSIATAYGWLKTEGFMFVYLLIGGYAAMLGGGILTKEENDKTIEYLGTLPIKRSRIVTNKVLVAIFYILLLIGLFGIFNFICLTISGDFYKRQFAYLSLTPIFMAIPLFAINLFISSFMHKTKKNVPISLGMVFAFYMLSVLSELSENVEFLKYFTIYTLADSRNVIQNVAIDYKYPLIALGISIIFIVGTYIRYNKKELVD